MEQLQRAVKKIRAGEKAEGGRILMEILRSDPENEQAWLWLAVAVKDREKKKQCLKRVLTINPNNQQAVNLLAKMEGKAAPPPVDKPRATPPVIEQDAKPTSQEQEKASPFQQPDIPPERKDPEVSPPLAEEEPLSPETPQSDRTFGELVGIWTRFFRMSETFFKNEVQYANSGDTLLSVLVMTIGSVFGFLITGSIQFQSIMSLLQEQGALSQQMPNFGLIFLGMLVGTVIFTPISFYITVGLQYVSARLFAGTGTFSAQAYLQSLIQVPLTVLGGIVSLGALLPFANCILGPLGLGISIFGLIVSVRAIKAVHGLTTGRAVGALIAPPILIMLLIGCALIATGTMIGPILEGVISQQAPIP